MANIGLFKKRRTSNIVILAAMFCLTLFAPYVLQMSDIVFQIIPFFGFVVCGLLAIMLTWVHGILQLRADKNEAMHSPTRQVTGFDDF